MLIRRFLGLIILLAAIAGIVGAVALTVEDEENAHRLRREEVVVLPEDSAAKVRLLDPGFGSEDPIVRRSRGESLQAFARLETGFVPAPEAGATVAVVFDPETPGMVKLDHPVVIWQNQIILGVLVVIFLWAGSALVRAPRGVLARPAAVPAARARAAKPARAEAARQESVSRSATAARTESVARTGTAARAAAVVQRTAEGAVVARATHGPTIDRSGERTGPLGLILVIGVIVLAVLVYLFQGQIAALVAG